MTYREWTPETRQIITNIRGGKYGLDGDEAIRLANALELDRAALDAERAAHEATKAELERMASHMETVLKICSTDEGYLPGGLQAATALTGSDRPLLRAAKQMADLLADLQATRELLREAVGTLASFRASLSWDHAAKKCGHDYTCTCDADALRAFLARPQVAAINREVKRG